MDHDAAREQLELAALEPGGLERLMAGDTATAQAVAAHLAGCPSCSDELIRLGRAAAIIREAVRELPPADLRARTLSAIRAEGVQRPLVAAATAEPTAAAPPVAITTAGARRASRGQILGWVGTVAAAVVLSVATTSFVVGSRVDEQLAAQEQTIAELESVTTATLAVTDEPDAEHVDLHGVTDATLDGSLVFSPSTAELVVVAYGLTPPPSGLEYRCWVEIAGQRTRVGKMFFSDELAYWAGPAPAVSELAGDATFGVSLVGASGGSVDADPVLVGDL
jgi:anti-sigma factor RsiW